MTNKQIIFDEALTYKKLYMVSVNHNNQSQRMVDLDRYLVMVRLLERLNLFNEYSQFEEQALKEVE